MSRPKAGYRLADGTKVPGVTTVIGRFKESGGLIWWANRLAFDPLGQAHALLEGVQKRKPNREAIDKFLEVPLSAYDHNNARDRAADAGTLAHAMVEAHLTGGDPDAETKGKPADVVSNAQTAFLAFLEWADSTKLKVVETELSLVSEKHRYGGTLDARVLTVNGRLTIGDWKTSNGLYPDMLIQVAAYKSLFEETHPRQPVKGGLDIFRFSKDTGDFHHHHYDELTAGWEQFLLLRQAYEIDKELKKRAK
ncbi:MAG: hypothetical protein V3W44_08660 [Dehalococcoidales bacterium]